VTLKEALAKAGEALIKNNIEDAPLESELLLCHTLRIDRVQLYLELDRKLTPEQEATFWQFVNRRLKDEPTAYITGRREFYGLDFYVDPAVLIPRPESELLVEQALKIARSAPINTIADIGTGCGAIAISLAKKLPEVKIYATDISAEALAVARINSKKHDVTARITLLQGNLLEALPEPVDLIIANLPYVRKRDIPKRGPLSFEPLVALDGGAAGLDKIRQLCRQLSGKLRPNGGLLLEIGRGQGEAVTELLRRLFPSALIEVTPDLAGIKRAVRVCLKAVSRER